MCQMECLYHHVKYFFIIWLHRLLASSVRLPVCALSLRLSVSLSATNAPNDPVRWSRREPRLRCARSCGAAYVQWLWPLVVAEAIAVLPQSNGLRRVVINQLRVQLSLFTAWNSLSPALRSKLKTASQWTRQDGVWRLAGLVFKVSVHNLDE